MSHTPDDISVPIEYCTPANEHSRAVSDGHINLSVQAEALQSSHASLTSTKVCSRVSRIPPRRIALCGGGIQGIAHVGVMKALAEEDCLKNVKEVIGISAGTLFALIWVLGYSIQQIEELALTLDFTLLRNITPEGIFNFPTLYGIDSGEGIDRLLNSVLRQKGFAPDATFEEIHQTCPVHLRCFATELQTSRLRQFGTLITPKVSVKFAVRASMSLPFFYTPVKEIATGALLVDGGVLNNLPLVFLNANEMKDTWCVFFTCEPFKTPAPVTSVTQMFKMIFDSTLIMKSLPYIEKFKDHVIQIPSNMMNSLEFDKSVDSRKELIGNAYRATKQFLFTQTTKPARRFSAC